MLILKRPWHGHTTFWKRPLVSDMVLIARGPLRNILSSIGGFELKIQRAFFTGNCMLDVLFFPPVTRMNKKYTGPHKMLACNRMRLDSLMGVNNSRGYSTVSIRGTKTAGLRVSSSLVSCTVMFADANDTAAHRYILIKPKNSACFCYSYEQRCLYL
jgi:hypothetical protein